MATQKGPNLVEYYYEKYERSLIKIYFYFRFQLQKYKPGN